ncbi:hypothetical protein R1sor_005044 [Riccia sorocarpa]|uniref:Uncharacterized protein n=1 Tax=Riccia sorocarpa TaxID=122646 RepID=A0ABD3HJ10_9MARC
MGDKNADTTFGRIIRGFEDVREELTRRNASRSSASGPGNSNATRTVNSGGHKETTVSGKNDDEEDAHSGSRSLQSQLVRPASVAESLYKSGNSPGPEQNLEDFPPLAGRRSSSTTNGIREIHQSQGGNSEAYRRANTDQSRPKQGRASSNRDPVVNLEENNMFKELEDIVGHFGEDLQGEEDQGVNGGDEQDSRSWTMKLSHWPPEGVPKENIEQQVDTVEELPVGLLALVVHTPGQWADITEEEMPEQGSRGIKGRPMDINTTPDKGNQSKRRVGERRDPIYRKVLTFSQLIPPLEDTEAEVQGNLQGIEEDKPPDKEQTVPNQSDKKGSEGEELAPVTGTVHLRREGTETSQRTNDDARREGMPTEMPKRNFSSYNPEWMD